MKEVIKLLKKGKIMIYPTDTAYALGGDFLNKKVRSKIYKIKKRDVKKELPAIAGSLSMVKKYCYINASEMAFIKKYWPGTLTIILKVKPVFQQILGTTIAMRIPSNKIARYLSSRLNSPIIATSANVSGKANCYNINDAMKQFSKFSFKPDIIIDAGELEKIPVSTIIKVDGDKIKIFRQGAIKFNLKS